MKKQKRKAKAPRRESEAVELLKSAIARWGEDIDDDEPISGADAVDWLANFIQHARFIVGQW